MILLIQLLINLVDKGHSVGIVEHNTDVMRHSDWIIDLGPESANCGGKIVAEGPPEDIAASPHSFTGQYLCFGDFGDFSAE